MGFTFVCCEHVLLPLINKEAALAYDLDGKTKLNAGIKKTDSGRQHVAAEERCWTSVLGYGLVVYTD